MAKIGSKTQQNTDWYISNPFKLTFKGMEAWLKYNKTLGVLVIAATMGGVLLNIFSTLGTNTTESNQSPANNTVAFVTLLFIVGAIFVSTVYTGMVAYVSVMTLKKKSVTMQQALQVAISKFWIVLFTHVLVLLKVLGGLILFIVPGVRAGLRYSLVTVGIFDKDLSPTAALKYSKEITKHHLVEVFGMITAASIVPVVSGLLLAGGQMQMYHQLTKLKTGQPKPKVHWLNYFGFFIIFLVMLFIMLILSLLLIVIFQSSNEK